MVYRGKPSTACGECRKRRNRCDKGIPACGQCVKTGRKCPGYRNTMDLMFHDESKQIAEKNKNQDFEDAQPPAGSGRSAIERAVVSVATTTPMKLIDFVLYQPMADLGVNYFMSTYVGEDSTVSQLFYLPNFYAKTGYSNPALQQSITAAGLAGYAKTSRQKDVSNAALKRYVQAIQAINTALSDSKTAMHESTLLAIMMLSMFEVLIMPRMSDMQNSAKHLVGAVTYALMMLQYKKPTEVTLRIITTLTQSVIISTWISHTSLPPKFLELKKELDKHFSPISIHGRFLDIIMELNQFRQALQNGAYKHPADIVDHALAIDRSLDHFSNTMPPHAIFQVVQLSGQVAEKLAYRGYYHIYDQRFTAHLWNNIRSSRLRLHQVILRQCPDIISSSPTQDQGQWRSQQTGSRAMIETLAIEIAASLPQLAGYLERLESRRIAERDLPVRVTKMTSTTEPSQLPRVGKVTRSGITKYDTHFSNDPSPFRKCDNTSSLRPDPTSIFYAEHSDKTKVDTPAHIHPPVCRPQPSSVYHILFQMYSLRSIDSLPRVFLDWIQDRTVWMENICDEEDLVRLQDMMRKRPGDDFPADNEDRKPRPKKPASKEPKDADESKWLLVHNWCSVGWDHLNQEPLDSDTWVKFGLEVYSSAHP
ncbi:hypothetical protein BDU57DRAFT_510489 [Ampelomyces quisqualis]|uniref:Zn(2)-C6 fungal-type domain-containing protein n=1 Tax=Ampelomyces quisqualis TaxID=50730 RepID=A0A6A5R1M5_AMPQU|nr:hypothetical protein BDU57DRAFT_510489 [Ampelomyces quisqualis]